MRLIALFAFVISSVLVAAGQAPRATPPPPQPRPTPAQTPQRAPITAFPARPTGMQRLPDPFPLNPVSESDRLAARIVRLQQIVSPLYRKPTGKELDVIAPDPRLEAEYAEFLKLPETGIFRLVPDAGCAPNSKVVSAREDCLKYSMPGAGNSFSFRTENYRIRRLADVTYDGSNLNVTGVFMHGFMTKLGDISIGSVTLDSPGMKFIADFKPSTSAADVAHIDAAFRTGIEVRGYRYAMGLPAEPGATYAYRGVAYRGKVVRVAAGVRYNELDYDKREDVIVAFRVVERSEDGSITIVWRRLAEYDAPRIKMPSKRDEDSATTGN